MSFNPNRKFKRQYDRFFKEDPMLANVYLLLCELADEKGNIKIPGESEDQVSESICILMAIRFNDPKEYAL